MLSVSIFSSIRLSLHSVYAFALFMMYLCIACSSIFSAFLRFLVSEMISCFSWMYVFSIVLNLTHISASLFLASCWTSRTSSVCGGLGYTPSVLQFFIMYSSSESWRWYSRGRFTSRVVANSLMIIFLSTRSFSLVRSLKMF